MRANANRPPRKRRLQPRGHTVYRLSEQAWLVFKPAGHTEPEHTHPYSQTLHVVAGELAVTSKGRTVTLDAASAPYRVRAREPHATHAMQPTWLVVTQHDLGEGRHTRQRRARTT